MIRTPVPAAYYAAWEPVPELPVPPLLEIWLWIGVGLSFMLIGGVAWAL